MIWVFGVVVLGGVLMASLWLDRRRGGSGPGSIHQVDAPEAKYFDRYRGIGPGGGMGGPVGGGGS